MIDLSKKLAACDDVVAQGGNRAAQANALGQKAGAEGSAAQTESDQANQAAAAAKALADKVAADLAAAQSDAAYATKQLANGNAAVADGAGGKTLYQAAVVLDLIGNTVLRDQVVTVADARLAAGQALLGIQPAA